VRREIKAGMYSFTSYFIAQLLIQIPYMILLSTFCIGVSGYGMGSWNVDAFLPSLLVHACFMFTFECVAQLYAVQFRHPLLGMFQVVNFWFASFLFGGFLIPESDTPWPFRAFTYISPIKYGTRTLMNLEFKGTEWKGAVAIDSGRGFYCPGNPVACYGATGEQVLETLSQTVARNVTVEDKLIEDCMWMLAIAFAFKLLFYIMAASKCYDGKEVKQHLSDSSSGLPTILASKQTNVKKVERSVGITDEVV